MLRLTKFRLVEIGVALLLTFAALVIFGWRVWAEDNSKPATLAGSSRAEAFTAGSPASDSAKAGLY